MFIPLARIFGISSPVYCSFYIAQSPKPSENHFFIFRAESILLIRLRMASSWDHDRLAVQGWVLFQKGGLENLRGEVSFKVLGDRQAEAVE